MAKCQFSPQIKEKIQKRRCQDPTFTISYKINGPVKTNKSQTFINKNYNGSSNCKDLGWKLMRCSGV